MSRARRLKDAVKMSKKTADQIIISFEEEAKKRNIKLPTSPVTISRHMNGKRAFDIDESIAYAHSLGIDPAEICFKYVQKNIIGKISPETHNITWNTDLSDIKSIRVPRDFYNKRYLCLEEFGVESQYHGALIIYENTTADSNFNKNFLNPRLFNQLSILEYKTKGKNKFCIGFPKPIKKNEFLILDKSGKLFLDKTIIVKIDPVVSVILPNYWRHFDNN